MKRTQWILSMLLLAALIASALGCGAAENAAGDAPWQADILKLMDPSQAPKVTTLACNPCLPEGGEIVRRSFSQDLVSNRGDVLNVTFSFALTDGDMGEGQWATVTDWLKALVLSAVQNVQADSQSLANVIYEGYRAQRVLAQPGETGLPAWASESLQLEQIVAAVPWYPELSVDVNGEATVRLQEKLIELGYLTGRPDGFYGEKTKAAVMDLETYVRELEQALIDALPDPTPTPTPEPTPTPPPNAIPMVLDEPLTVVEPDPTPAPTPVTPVDGVADGLLQAYLYSADFPVCRGALRMGDEGSAVTRVQTRLNRLGYTTDAPDGLFGGGTARAVRVFQYYNGLDQTGIADEATQLRLFSGQAIAPDNAMLNVGASGEAVSRLQKRLRVLGFASIAVDGGYGASTKAGVENLQAYMRELESEALPASAAGTGDEGALTVVVNGVADPLLLDSFYADSFPAIPSDMASGATGRDVVRLQRRLKCLEYYTGVTDGQYGSGTQQAVKDFQKRHRLPATGVADNATLQALFDESAKKALKPYVLKVSVSDQRVYAYAPDGNDEYTDLVRTMKCSTGRKSSPTPKGTFTETGPGARWHYFKKFDCWAQYAYYIEGDIMFHSVLYSQKEGKVTQSSVNHLGSRASHGCVRLSVDDAKWIYNHCPSNTKVIVY
ncbi:MAG: peptidoglycan-binding protein [Clostridia bacterium]|nr:peptidoglycan-binding protein [Clostridia bacterium]